jgi:hypothetical protein
LTLTGGGASSYTWTDGTTTYTDGLAFTPAVGTATYTVTGTDVNSCKNTNAVTVTVNPLPTVVANATPATICLTDPTTLTGSGATTYTWDNGVTDGVPINPTSTTTYTVTGTDANSCENTATISVTVNPLPTATYIVSDASCSGFSDGSVDLSPSGGAGSYTYLWDDPLAQTTEDIITAPGTYSVTVTDVLGCEGIISNIVVGAASALIPSLVVTSPISCNGDADGEITASLSGGTTPYTYSIDGGITFQSSPIFTALGAGLKTIIFKDFNGCTEPDDILLTQPNPLISNVTSFNNISCFGYGNGDIDITIVGGTVNASAPEYNVSWSPSATSVNSIDLSNINTQAIYTATITDAHGCSSTVDRYISEPDAMQTIVTVDSVSCYGDSDGSIDLLTTGGSQPYIVSWVGPNGYTSPIEDIQLLEAGIYTYNVTDQAGCTLVSPTVYNVPVEQPAEIIVVPVVTLIDCYGNSNGSIDLTISGITGTPGILWSGPNSFISTQQNISSLIAGVYDLVVTDPSTNCALPLSQVMNPIIVHNIDYFSSDVSCYNLDNGSINITPYNLTNSVYSWVGPNGFSSTQQNINNLSPGNYQLIVDDDSNCPQDSQFVITEPTSLSVSPSLSQVSCEGGSNGSIDLSISGGSPLYSYLWNNGATTKDVANLPEGLFSVTVLDQKGCSWDSIFTLTTLEFDTASVTVVPVDCNGASTASIDIDSITGGFYPYSFSWTSPAGFVSNNEDILNIISGIYTLSITDASGCTITRSVIVSEPSSLSSFILSIDSVQCNGYSDGSVEVQTSGGTVPYLYDWGSANPDSLVSGNHIYTITDGNGCEITNSVFVPEPSPILITPFVIDVDCPDDNTGSISLSISGASSLSTISWIGPPLPSIGVLTGLLIDSLPAGDYSCVVTNEDGCQAQLNVSVSEPSTEAGTPNFSTSNYSTFAISCYEGNDGWIKIEMIGGDYGPDTYKFLWDTGDITDSLYDLYEGTYQLIIEDSINCQTLYTYTLTDPDSAVGFTYILSDTNGYNISCYDNEDAYIKINASGGVQGYTYEWYKNDTLALSLNKDSVYNLEAANYYVVVTDKNNCSFADTITINQPDSLYFNLITATDTCSLNKGFAEIEPFGGVAGYKYYWSTGDLLSYVDTLSEGRYEAVLQDANFCESSKPFDIVNLPSPIADFTLNPAHKKLHDQIENPFVFIDNSETFMQSIATWNWTLSDNTQLWDSIAYHSFTDVGDYTVLLTIVTDFNCIDTISKKVKVENYVLWIPTAFLPESNIIENTIFKPKGEGVKEFVMKIYSRWGGLVFMSESIDYGWDGFDGKGEVMTGSYTYYIEVVNIFDEVHKYIGEFKLIR